MSQATQLHLPLGNGSEQTDNGFYDALNYIRQNANSQFGKGRLFERLIQAYLLEDPFYKKRFSEVYLWTEWAQLRPEVGGVDLGIDLVATERDGGYCAIQCKCYAEDKRISKADLDSFISESNRKPYTARMFVDTGKSWSKNLLKAIDGLQPPCQRISAADLASRPVQWPDLSHQAPDQLDYQLESFSLREHQQKAFDDVINGFKDANRGKLIMACGTGKTFTALRIAEEIADVGGRVLYLVPSIGLFSQAMREWAEQQAVPHRYIGICSDTRAGKTTEDASLLELEIPVTTDEIAISEALQKTDKDNMRVVFCTYHSLPKVEEAQDAGAPAFDIILCDEGHRTTGIERSSNDDKTSPFVLVHDADRIRANKRLYMTATPRLYTESAKAKAAQHKIDVFSMDDPKTYGPEFHHLPFSKAVEQDLLSDYKVVVLAMSEKGVMETLHGYLSNGGSEININDATKIVGCWRALQNPERKSPDDTSNKQIKRAIAFTNTIKTSQNLVNHWNGIIESAMEKMPEDQRPQNFKCETAHVDGKNNALERKQWIEWLKGDSDSEGVCRILSNARCLSEGIDVPALDAVLFMAPRNSHVDIVQAVGRVMRKAPGKQYGYIVLPVAIPPDVDPVAALNDNERFATVWSVLRALRSHDDRLNAEINKIDLNNDPGDIIIIDGNGNDGENGTDTLTGTQLQLLPIGIPADAIYAKIVEKCGDRRYWESWAKDVADIFKRLVGRIENLLDNPDNSALQMWFDDFHNELTETINDSITRESAVDMMAQHIITRPVFEALFDNYDFASGNPVANALNKLQNDFGEFGLENETRDLEGFYESVRMRARGLDNSEARQRVLLELYEKFFVTALKKEVERLGIVYTPIEVVDFILHSTNEVLQDEFGRSLSDEGVHVLDPFTGTGIFLTRLLQSGIIQEADLERKYREELHANEIVLLAYYIATVNIEEAFRGQRGEDSTYEPFNGIVLTDTFNLNKKEDEPTLFPKEWLPDNSTRAEHQQKLPIQVIVGNPPWSAGQKSASDDNPNVEYLALEERISETYAEYSDGTNIRYLYDTYKMAIRWASDRIGEQGIIAFVTNGSWIDGNSDSGVRACLAEEFSSVYVLHLRGNQRTQGERSRREGGKVFGGGSRAPVAITILVKNPNATHEACKIQYRDIGDYLTREEKLDQLREKESISGFSDWETITPDKHHDWIEQRNEAFGEFYPLGSEDAKAGKTDNAIFGLYSLGIATGRDVYIYNFSNDGCTENAKRMTQDYLNALQEYKDNPELTANEAAREHSSYIKWNDELKNKIQRKIQVKFEKSHIRNIAYRPFIATNCYADYTFIQRRYQMVRIFPDVSSKNRLICVPGKGSKKPFSVLMTNKLTDLNLNEAGARCFPRYSYPKPSDKPNASESLLGIEDTPDRIDNISDTALRTFREHYNDDTITKDAIFDYVYGILHAPNYCEQFANDLSKMIPRIPFAPDFHAFAEAGKKLAELHLNYETCEQYPLSVEFPNISSPPTDLEDADPNLFLLTEKAMRFGDIERRTLIINEHVRLSSIPEDAHRYIVNGRSPLEWFIDRYKIKTDPDSGIVNDANGWFADPRDLITAIERIIHLSVQSTRIIDTLPAEITDN